MKYLVYYNDGSCETSILIIAKDKQEAENLFKVDCAEDEDFVKSHCFPTCKIIYIKEIRPLEEVVKTLVTDKKLVWDDIAYEVKHLSSKVLREVRNEVVKGYDAFRDPLIDKGRLPEQVMDNMMLVTTVIDFYIFNSGGEV
jgi:hypothetical protein